MGCQGWRPPFTMTDLLKPDLWKSLQKVYGGTELPKTFDLEPKEDE